MRVALGPVRSSALTFTVPRTARAVMRPVFGSGITARTESAGFANTNPIGVPGIAAPCASNASATSVTDWPNDSALGGFTNRTPVADAPTPTYTSVGAATGALPGVVLRRSGDGPARKTVSPAGLVIASRRMKSTLGLFIGTVSLTAMLS